MAADQVLALIISTGSALLDLEGMRLPNGWTGLCAVLAAGEMVLLRGPSSVGRILAGMAVPFLLLFPVWFVFYRSVGAGDIKLLMVLGEILGPAAILRCVFRTFLFGSLFSLLILFLWGGFRQRLRHLAFYLKNAAASGWKNCPAYRRQKAGIESVHMTIPILMSVLLWMGGI